MNKISTKNLVLCGLFAALTAVFSQIAIDIGPVPINLATLSVYIAGGLLGWKYGATSQIVYVLLGMVGVPVFAKFSGGFGIVMGKTGGYIIGYVVAALITGFFAEKVKLPKAISLPIGMILGTVALYALGTLWFTQVTGNGFKQSLVWCVYPFIPGDIVKIIFATFLVVALQKALRKTKLI